MKKFILLLLLLCNISLYANNVKTKDIVVYEYVDSVGSIHISSGVINYMPTRYTFELVFQEAYLPTYNMLTNYSIGFNDVSVEIYDTNDFLIDSFGLRLFISNEYTFYSLASEGSRAVTQFIDYYNGFIKINFKLNKDQHLEIFIICGNYVDD